MHSSDTHPDIACNSRICHLEWIVSAELQIEQQFAEKKERAKLGIDEIGVFPEPPGDGVGTDSV